MKRYTPYFLVDFLHAFVICDDLVFCWPKHYRNCCFHLSAVCVLFDFPSSLPTGFFVYIIDRLPILTGPGALGASYPPPYAAIDGSYQVHKSGLPSSAGLSRFIN